MRAAGRRDSIRTPAVVRFEGANPANLEKSGDSSVERAGAEFDAGELLDIEHHAVTVFIAVCQAREDEESSIHCHNTFYDAS